MSFIRGRAAAGRGAARVLLQLVICCGFVTTISAAETSKGADSGPSTGRFYAGVAVANLAFDDSYAGIDFSDASAGVAVFGGASLSDRVSLELSYDSLDAIDLHDVAGSGVTRFDVRTRRRTAAFSVLREVSLREIFGWQRDWRVFGLAGVYRSALRRSVLNRGENDGLSSNDDIGGLLLGAGALYRVHRVDLRGYVRQFGVGQDSEGREVGFAVQRRF
jgi:hypothetical protein